MQRHPVRPQNEHGTAVDGQTELAVLLPGMRTVVQLRRANAGGEMLAVQHPVTVQQLRRDLVQKRLSVAARPP